LDSYVLGFLSGHRLLISSPAAESNDSEGWRKIEDNAFSVLDAETGKVVNNAAGPNPGRPSNENIAIDMAISPDELLIAVIFRGFAKRRVGIFSGDNWHEVATLDLHSGASDDDLSPITLAFTPDGKNLAIAHGQSGRVKFYDVGSWKLSRTIVTFPERPPQGGVVLLDAISFSHDGALMAVASHSGGSWWLKDNIPVPEGSGTLKQVFPVEPLRVYRVSNGELVGSLGSFPGGLDRNAALAWSAQDNYLAFLDGVGDIRVWDPRRPGLSVIAAHLGHNSKDVLFSNDGSQLFANFPGGIRVFEIVQNRSRIAR
jgi:WD40 repeat protein